MTAPIVTDHAVVRFLQRICGFHQGTVADFRRDGVDVDDVRSMIANIVQSGVDARAAMVTWKGLRFVLRGTEVATVLTRDQYCTYTMPGRQAFLDGDRPRRRTA